MVNYSGKKMVFVINTLNGGGAERVISNLGNHFHNRDAEVLMVCLNEANPAYFLAPGIRVLSLLKGKRNTDIFSRIYYAIRTFFKLYVLLKKERPACTVSFMTSANLWTGMAAGLLKIPYLISERITPDYTVNKFNWLFRSFTASIYSKSAAIVVPSKGMVAGFRRKSAIRDLKNFEVINNPIQRFGQRGLTRVYAKKFILSVGRLTPQKGFDLLIIAFKRLQMKDIDLIISGEGPERKNLENQINELGLSKRIRLIGYQENLQDYYLQSELFVLSSRNEGYPNVLLEAMSLGCSCVATDCEFGPADIITHGKNGMLVKPDNVYLLSAAMGKLLNDPLLKAKISWNAKLVNQTNSLENTTAKWEELILKSMPA